MFPLDDFQIERYFGKHNTETKTVLAKLNDNDIAFEIDLLKKKHAREKSGMSLEKYLDRTGVRYLHSLMVDLLKSAPELRMYHRIKNSQGNYLISKCSVHRSAPDLSFEVEERAGGGLYIQPLIHTDMGIFSLENVSVYKFLVDVKEGNYYCLNTADYRTLEWLHLSQPEQYATDPVLFSQRIVQKLEETHKVNRNNLFQKQEIKALPENCIYVSEISDSLLMFTPKWRYENIIIEGDWKECHETIRNGEMYTIFRDQKAESDFLDYLKSLHPNFSKQSGKFFYLNFSDAKKKQWFLKTYHTLLEQSIMMIGLEMLKHFRYSSHTPVNSLTILAQEEEILTLQLKIHFGKEKISLSELQKLLLAGQSAILLKDSTIGVFSEEWLDQYAFIIKHGKISGDHISIPQWMMLSLEEGEAKTVLKSSVEEDWIRKWSDWQDEHKIVYPVPQKVNAMLRPYQHKGFEWLALLSEFGAGACLADDMGLGKTLQTITFLCFRQEQRQDCRHIIICPASLIYNWEAELRKFAPHLHTHVHNGNNRNIAQFFENNCHILITTYGTLRSDVEKIKSIPWDTAIVDESHNIKNVRAQLTKAALTLNAQNKIALSGTPIMNNTFDLYAQLSFLLPNLLGGQEFFKREYAHPIDQDRDQEKVKALQKLTAPFILRRTKEQVATDLPSKTESILWCEMGEQQATTYELIKSQIKDSIFLDIRTDGFAKSKLNILQGILKLRQVCGSPTLLSDFPEHSESVKICTLMEELENLKDNKALVFSQFKGMLHLVAEECRKKGISYFHFDGDTPVKERQHMVSQFQEANNTTRLFLISLKSGNAGLNLTAADYVFLMDPWWNSAVQQQAIDRTHRIGQDKKVFAYKMICKGTIEEKIIELQDKKQMLSDELVSAEDGFVKNLTEQDIMYLFD